MRHQDIVNMIIVFIDIIHYKSRKEKQIVVKVTYVVIGVNLDGNKDIL